MQSISFWSMVSKLSSTCALLSVGSLNLFINLEQRWAKCQISDCDTAHCSTCKPTLFFNAPDIIAIVSRQRNSHSFVCHFVLEAFDNHIYFTVVRHFKNPKTTQQNQNVIWFLSWMFEEYVCVCVVYVKVSGVLYLLRRSCKCQCYTVSTMLIGVVSLGSPLFHASRCDQKFFFSNFWGFSWVCVWCVG